MFFRSVSLFVLVFGVSTPVLAGPLTPPSGPVSSTVRFGPRIEVSQSTTPGSATSLFVISQPGSYYLGGNISGVAGKSGIEITTSGVTLDLIGFEINGGGIGLTGVMIVGIVTDLAIRNGTITRFTLDGIGAPNADNSLFERLRLSANGDDGLDVGQSARIMLCSASNNTGSGIQANQGATIDRCTAQSNGINGFLVRGVAGYATVNSCTAVGNGLNGFSLWTDATIRECVSAENIGTGIGIGAYGAILDCVVRDNGQHGIESVARDVLTAVSGSHFIVSGCIAFSNNRSGISMASNSIITNNLCANNTEDGIRCSGRCIVSDNDCVSNGFGGSGAGIHTLSFDNRIEHNHVSLNDRGINVDRASNLIVSNSASGNTIDYDIAAGNFCRVIQAVAAGAINGSAGGTQIGTGDPWSNFSY